MTKFSQKVLLFNVVALFIHAYSFTVRAPQRSPTMIQRNNLAFSTTRLHVLNRAGDDDPRRAEFDILEDDPMTNDLSSIRKERIEREKGVQESFAPYGNLLWDLRAKLVSLSETLMEKISSGEDTKSTRKRLRELKAQDANTVYGLELERMDSAIEDGRADDAENHAAKATDARSHLAQFNLEGLWVGKYGEHGFEMVNVTYIGDTLIGRKLTGDLSVPAGEITFQVDLSPQRRSKGFSNAKELSNIALSDEAGKRWGTKELQRFTGLGQVADEGFTNSQWLEGQIIFISEEHFSFAWLPIGHQVFFGRPSPEVSLSMMQEHMKKSLEKNDGASMDHVARCFEATVDAIEDGSLEDPSDSCICLDDDAFSCFE